MHTFTGHPPRNSWKFRHKIENRNKKCIRNPRVLLSLFFIKRIRNIYFRFGVLLCSILSSHSIIYAHLKIAKIFMKQGINILLLIELIKTLYRIIIIKYNTMSIYSSNFIAYILWSLTNPLRFKCVNFCDIFPQENEKRFHQNIETRYQREFCKWEFVDMQGV